MLILLSYTHFKLKYKNFIIIKVFLSHQQPFIINPKVNLLIMNITRLNFAQTLPYIKNLIKQSNYVSIDLEMSGIVSDVESNPSLVDSVWSFFKWRCNNDMLRPKEELRGLFRYKSVFVVTILIWNLTST